MVISDVSASRDTVVFTWAGQIWSAPLAGGDAKRLLPSAQESRNALFSPDGSRLAFAMAQGGSIDLYVQPAAGGDPQRVTDHPKTEVALGWTPDGKVLYESNRLRDASGELYIQGPGDPVERRLPLPRASQGSVSPSGNQLAYVRNTFFGFVITRRNYRGGAVGVIRLLDLKTLEEKAITKDDHNSVFPMWVGDSIYYLSDSKGSFNLAVYDLKTRASRELSSYRSSGITYASYSSGQIAFVRDGRVFVYAIDSGQTREVPITIPTAELQPPVDERAPRKSPIQRYLQWAALSNDGKSALLESRGDILLKPLDGPAVNLTNTPGVAERTPAISPDGKTLAYFTDASGEYQLGLRNMADGSTRSVAIEAKPTSYRELTWSPDGTRVAFSDLRLGLWVYDTSSSAPKQVDRSGYLAQELWHPTWRGGELIYSKAQDNGVRAIYAWDSRTDATRALTDGYTPADLPTSAGEAVYYTASASSLMAPGTNVWALQSSMILDPLVSHTVARIDDAGNVPLGAAPKYLTDLRATPNGTIFASAQNWGDTPSMEEGATSDLYRLPAGSRSWQRLASGITGFDVSADGSAVSYTDQSRGVWVMPADASEKEPAANQVDLSKDTIDVDPAQEWAQMYRDAFRMMRDRFYDPNHHGFDTAALEKHYAEYLPNLTRRTDLNLLLTWAFGEISISHLRVSGGDSPRPGGPSSQSGLLGADWTVENGHYRLARIYSQSDVLYGTPLARSPLAPIPVGAYLLSIDDQTVTPDKSLNSYLAGKAGREVAVAFSLSPDGSAPFAIKTRALPGENTLRMLAWVDENRRNVDQMSGGKLAYVYMPGYDEQGYANFIRGLFAAKGKDGLIIDQRFNGGGITSDWMIQSLLMKPLLAYEYPYGNDFTVPAAYVDGPKVLIINEMNGSAAETFALMFKNAKVGTVVGHRTYGAGVGVGLSGMQLVDGGTIAIPNRAGYNPVTGEWEIENFGVEPDIEVEMSAKDFAAGRDPELKTAVKTALAQAAKWKKIPLRRPKPPVHPPH